MTFADVISAIDALPSNRKEDLEVYVKEKRHVENSDYLNEMSKRLVEIQENDSFSSKVVRDLNQTRLEKSL